ncbi:MAG TPA: hypothetical protein VGL53_25470 [Bryobacteraceae bacterium]
MKRRLFLVAIPLLCLIAAGWGCSTHRVVPTAVLPKQVAPETERFDDAREIAEYDLARRSADRKPIPYERFAAAHLRSKQMLKRYPGRPSDSTLTSWKNLGPGNIAGLARTLLFDPQNPGTMYTTGINGGVWKSVDGGATWNELGDFLPVLVIGSLALAPQDSNTIYAGTGDGFISYDAVEGAGIFKSVNAGANWIRLASTANDSRFTFVNKLIVSPNAIDRIYAATNAGILRSDDGGTSWTLTLDRGFPQRGCQDMVVRTDQPVDVIVASCGIPGLRTNGALLNKVSPLEDGTLPATVFLNPDAANAHSSWTAVIADPNMGFTSLAVAPSNQNILYAAASSINGAYASALLAVYQSTDGGVTWQARVRNTDANVLNTVMLGYAINGICYSPASFGGQAWHDNAIAVDPLDPMRVWIGGVDLFRSDDGGANWGIASYWWGTPGSTPQYAHADHHAMVFPPNYDGAANQTMFDLNDGGIFRTDNARAPVSTTACQVSGSIAWRLASTDLITLQFYHGSILPGGQGYFGGAQDNGTVLGTETGGPLQWTSIVGGDGGATAIDPTNPNIMYASSTNSALLKSFDGGATFSNATAGINEANADFFLIGTFVMDPNHSTTLWTGGNTIWRTVNGAQSWLAASAPLVTQSFGSFAVAPGNSNLVLAGSRTGQIFRSANALSTGPRTIWPMTTPRVGWVSALVFDPVNPATVYAVYSSFNVNAGDAHIYKSVDTGITWTASDGSGLAGLPDAPYYTLAVNPNHPSVLWAAGDLGLFVSENGGQTWAREDSGFPVVPTDYLTIQADSQGLALYAFTHGRGLWRARIGSVPVTQ